MSISNIPGFFKNKTQEKNLHAKFVTLTPDDAKELLKLNISNRPVRNLRIEKYARAMKMSRWIPSNDAICISNTGILLNGQHRLEAIIKADTPTTVLIAYGLSESSFDIIDRGAQRTPGDLAAADGFSNPNIAVAGARAAIGILWVWSGMTIDFGKDRLLDADEILDWMNNYSIDLKYSVESICKFQKLKRGLVVGLHFALGGENHPWFEDVIKRASDGFPITGAQDPAYFFRNMFVENKIQQISNDDIFKIIKVITTGLKGNVPKIIRRGNKEPIPSPPKGWRKDAVYPYLPNLG